MYANHWITIMTTLSLTLTEPPATSSNAPRTAAGFLHKTTTIDGETYAWCLYVPPDYTPDKRWPTILALHGSGERGDDGFLQTDVGLGRTLRRQHTMIPALVVMPQCRSGMNWTGPMARLALRCIEETSREYRVDPNRLYLTGLSLGGQGAWIIGADYARYFAALVPICGFADLEENPELVEKIAPRLTDTPIWCFHGSDDKAVPVERSRELVTAVRQAGGNIQYTEYEGAGHVIWNRAYDDPALWQWLFSQKLE